MPPVTYRWHFSLQVWQISPTPRRHATNRPLIIQILSIFFLLLSFSCTSVPGKPDFYLTTIPFLSTLNKTHTHFPKSVESNLELLYSTGVIYTYTYTYVHIFICSSNFSRHHCSRNMEHVSISAVDINHNETITIITKTP